MEQQLGGQLSGRPQRQPAGDITAQLGVALQCFQAYAGPVAGGKPAESQGRRFEWFIALFVAGALILCERYTEVLRRCFTRYV